MKSNVDYTEFNKKFISNKKVETRSYTVPSKDTTGTEGKSNYNVLPLTYNLGSEEKPRYGNLSVKGPLFSTGGVHKKPNKYRPQVIDYTILIHFKQDNPEHVKFFEVFDDIYWATAQLIKDSEADLEIVKKKKFNPKACESVFTHPIYEKDGKKSFFLKFFKRGPYQTLLTGPDKQPKEWDKLIGANLDIYPIITFNWVHFGGEFSLITECKECIIRDANERKIETSEAAAIDEMNAENPDLALDVTNKLEKIMASYQEVQLPLPLTKEDVKKEHEETIVTEGGDTSSGIKPTESFLPDALGKAVDNANKKRPQFKIPNVDDNL